MATGRKGARPVEKSSAGAHDLIETVRALADVVTEHGLSELVLALPDSTITLRRGGTVMAPTGVAPTQVTAAQAPVGHAERPELQAVASPMEDRAHTVTSPFVGTFYRRPNPDSPEYCRLNDHVEKGAVLCIVEAMKLMNEIEADVSGTIVGIVAEDGSVVEFGQPLFKISPG